MYGQRAQAPSIEIQYICSMNISLANLFSKELCREKIWIGGGNKDGYAY